MTIGKNQSLHFVFSSNRVCTGGRQHRASAPTEPGRGEQSRHAGGRPAPGIYLLRRVWVCLRSVVHDGPKLKTAKKSTGREQINSSSAHARWKPSPAVGKRAFLSLTPQHGRIPRTHLAQERRQKCTCCVAFVWDLNQAKLTSGDGKQVGVHVGRAGELPGGQESVVSCFRCWFHRRIQVLKLTERNI